MSFISVTDETTDVAMKAASTLECIRKQDLSKGTVCRTFGRFTADFHVTSVQAAILSRLTAVYTDEMLETVLRPVLEQHEGWPSIRVIDWLLTNFAKSRRIVCTQLNGDRIHVYNEYKNMLAHFRRRNFDAFRRRLRVHIDAPMGPLESTPAQLNFFAWAHQTGILAWCRQHADAIERDMTEVASKRRSRPPGQRRRTELSAAPRTRVVVYNRTTESSPPS